MAANANLFQRAQIGLETTRGTAVAATRALLSTEIALGFKGDFSQFAPMGSAFNTRSDLINEWTDGKIRGKLDYNEATFLFDSALGNRVTTTLLSGAKQHTFQINAGSDDVIPYFTVEQGNTANAHRAAGAQLTALGFAFDRGAKTADMTGELMATQLEVNSVFTTAGVTALAPAKWLPQEVSVYIDNTQAALGTTKYGGRVLKASYDLGGKIKPVWTLDAAKASYDTPVKAFPSLTVKLTLEADAAGVAALAKARAQGTSYIRIASKSSLTAATSGANTDTYSCNIDSACQITNIGQFTADQDLYCVEVDYTIVQDANLFSHLVTLVNTCSGF